MYNITDRSKSSKQTLAGTGSERPQKFARSNDRLVLAPNSLRRQRQIARSPRAFILVLSCPDTWRGVQTLLLRWLLPSRQWHSLGCVLGHTYWDPRWEAYCSCRLRLNRRPRRRSTEARRGRKRAPAVGTLRAAAAHNMVVGSALESIQSGFRHSLAWDRTIHKEVNNQSKIAQNQNGFEWKLWDKYKTRQNLMELLFCFGKLGSNLWLENTTWFSSNGFR